MTPAHQRLMTALAVAACACLMALALTGAGDALAHLAPLALVLVPLLVGRYPGEARLSARVRRAERRRRVPAQAAPRAISRARPRGGALLASGLAGRAPPGGA